MEHDVTPSSVYLVRLCATVRGRGTWRQAASRNARAQCVGLLVVGTKN